MADIIDMTDIGVVGPGMTAETHALRLRRKLLLEKLSRAADEVKRIDDRLSSLLEGRRPGAGSA